MTVYFVNEADPSHIYTSRHIDCDEQPASLYRASKEIEEVLREIVIDSGGAIDAFIVDNKIGVFDNKIVTYRLVGWEVVR